MKARYVSNSESSLSVPHRLTILHQEPSQYHIFMICQVVKYIVYFLCLPMTIFYVFVISSLETAKLSHAFHPHNELLLLLRSSLFWDVARRRLVVRYRRFGTTSVFQLQGLSSPRKNILRLLYP